MALSVKTRRHIRRWRRWRPQCGGTGQGSALAAAITLPPGSALHSHRRRAHGDRAHFDGSHRSGCRSAAVRHAAAGRARRSRLVPDRGRGAAGRPALHGAGHGGFCAMQELTVTGTHNGGAAF